MPRMSVRNSSFTVDMCHLQGIFDQSWMEKTNQSHYCQRTDSRTTSSRRRCQRPCQTGLGGSQDRSDGRGRRRWTDAGWWRCHHEKVHKKKPNQKRTTMIESPKRMTSMMREEISENKMKLTNSSMRKREQAKMNDEEETEGAEINIEEFEADEARDAVVEYPAWLKRVEFGSKVLPVEPCMIGDAQPETHQDLAATNWIEYPQDLQAVSQELLRNPGISMAIFSAEPAVQTGFRSESALSRWRWWW